MPSRTPLFLSEGWSVPSKNPSVILSEGWSVPRVEGSPFLSANIGIKKGEQRSLGFASLRSG
jgi:hypothetical protein